MEKQPLEKNWLYAVSSPKDLARRLSTKNCPITVRELEAFAGDAGNFKVFRTKKGRDVQQPCPRLQRLHRYIHEILARIETPDYLHSAVEGRSYITNALAHEPGVPTIKIDVKKFFRSVPRSAVFRFFSGPMGCARDVAGLLANLLTYGGHLPTGGSASPVIAFYACKPMFDSMEGLARSRGLKMTCYVDDMTFTGTRASRGALQEARLIIAGYGLKSHKTKFLGANRPKVITGVAITADGPKLPNRRHRAIHEALQAYRAAADFETSEKAFNKLIGRMHEAGQIEPRWRARARTLQREHTRARAANIISRPQLIAAQNREVAVSRWDQPDVQDQAARRVGDHVPPAQARAA